MKAREIVKRFDIDMGQFREWIETTEYSYKDDHWSVPSGVAVDDSHDIDAVVSEFKKFQENRQIQIELEKAKSEKAAGEKQQAMANMLVTSGFSFEGFSITKYSGYISGDDVIQIDRGSSGWFQSVTNVGEAMMDSLVEIRRNALVELKEAAYNLGCNAVIGVDFDYLVMDPETVNSNGGTLYLPYVLGVTANGNAVTIKKS